MSSRSVPICLTLMARGAAASALAIGMAIAPAARAGSIPSAANSTIPPFVRLVGDNAAGVPDPRGSFSVTLRDASMNLLPGYTVWIDIRPCGELKGCRNLFGTCSANAAEAVTDINGVARLTVIGGRGSGAPVTTGCAEIFGQGVPLGHCSVAAFDQNGINGVDGIDVGLWAADLFSGVHFWRSDYDGDGDIDGIDLGLLADVLFGAGSTSGCDLGICP